MVRSGGGGSSSGILFLTLSLMRKSPVVGRFVNPSLWAALLLLTGSVGASAAPRQDSAHYRAKMEGIVANLKETKYQSKTVVDHGQGVFKGNCSALIGYVMRENFPEAYLSVRGRRAPWRVRPLAVTFYETFVALKEDRANRPAWEAVTRMMEVKPGDIIAWRKLTITEGLNTGHICMIAGEPVMEGDGRVRVRIIDSTSGRHANDTREKGSNGVGAGEMWFAVNEAGAPVGYWLHEKSKRSKTNKIAIGRIVPVQESGSFYPKPLRVKGKARDGDFIGLAEAEAAALAKTRLLKARVISRDGKSASVTREITDGRVNFILKKGKVFRTIRG